MKNILWSTILLLCSVCVFTSCDDDNDSNPTLLTPTQFVLNTPAAATNTVYDLANSTTLELTCSQPNYGFPVTTAYKVQVATKSDMSDAVELSTTYQNAKMNISAAEVATDLTNLELGAGKAETDFPMTIPVYIRLRANATTSDGVNVEGAEILSNIVKLSSVKLLFSLPPVTTPDNVYIVGKFCGWDWGSCLKMVQVYGAKNVFWHMVYIDDSGIKINIAKAWDGGQKGYAGLNSVSGDLASEIKAASDDNIISSKPGWYLMIVTTSVSGRKILYDVQFNKPEVRFIGKLIGGWDEGKGDAFTVPATADGQFVSPAMSESPGNEADGSIRMYCKIPGNDWWHSEFIVGIDGANISYRGTGGDQARVGSKAGQKVYLNFSTDKGEIK